MQIDNNIKNSLLSLDDKTLKNVVNSLAKSAGVDTSNVRISDSDIMKIRSVIRNATDDDANEALKVIGDENARKIINEAKKRSGRNE